MIIDFRKGKHEKGFGSDGSIKETINNYPFGSEMRMENPAQMAGEFLQPYRFTGKELDRVNGLNMYDFGARWYDVAGVPMWTSVDPLAEKYYHVSPYAYCGGDPVNFVDPDGRTIKIYYQNSDGDSYVYNLNGKTRQFSDPFVQDFIDTYWFFKETGGGENVIDAVEDTNTIIDVSNAEEENGGTYFDIEEREFTVHWESRKGLFLSNGGKQSPATRLEHEFDHAMSRKNDAYSHRIRQSKKGEIYENGEEKRVIQGSESKTAKKHHEGVRYDHKGKTYDTEGRTTTKRKIK